MLKRFDIRLTIIIIALTIILASAGISAITLIGISIIAMLASRLLSAPLRQLTQQAETIHIQNDEPTTAPNISYASSEITTLQNTLNTLNNRILKLKNLEEEQAQQLLRDQQRYKIINDLISDYAAYVIVDAEGELYNGWMIGAYTEMLGYEVTAPSSHINLINFIHPEDARIVEQAIKAVLKNETTTCIYRAKHKEGHYIWMEVIRQPVWDEKEARVTGFYSSAQNVSDRMEAQLRLEEREARYKQVSELMSDYAAYVRVDKESELYSDWMIGAYTEMLGFDVPESGAHITLGELIHPEDFTLAEQAIKGVLKNETTTCVYRAKHKAGHYIWLEVTRQPIWDENEKRVTGFYSATRNIDEQMEAQLRLQESEARYRTVVHNFPNGLVALYDHDLRYTLVDGTGLAEIGLSPADLEGKKLRDVFPPEIYERDEPQLLAALNGEATDTLVTLGEEYFRVLTIPLRNSGDEVIGGMVMSQNISPLKRAEEALRESEEKYRVLVETNPDLISRLTRASTHLYANTSLLKFLNMSPEQVIGKTNTEIGVPKETQVAFDALREQVFTTAQETEYFFSYPTPDGGERDFHLRLIPEFDSEHNVLSILSITRDITVHNLAQKQAFDLALERERRQLLTNFIKDVAHEFRTPLSTIGTSAYLLSRLDDTQSRQTKLRLIELQVRLITRLVDTLLLQFKLQNMDLLSHSQVNITRLLNSLHQQALTNYGDSHDIQYPAYPDALIVPGDEEYLSNAIRQIIDNACRFTEHGSKITLSVTKEENWVLIHIRDNGGNIPKDALPDIFKTFWRRDTAHSTPGLGLGLPIAKQIIELHEGTISVDSEPGIQNTFQIRLPLIGTGMTTG